MSARALVKRNLVVVLLPFVNRIRRFDLDHDVDRPQALQTDSTSRIGGIVPRTGIEIVDYALLCVLHYAITLRQVPGMPYVPAPASVPLGRPPRHGALIGPWIASHACRVRRARIIPRRRPHLPASSFGNEVVMRSLRTAAVALCLVAAVALAAMLAWRPPWWRRRT